MSLTAKLRRAPGRIAAGAFILDSGVKKLQGDEQTAQAIHGMASGAYPMLGSIKPALFLRLLGVTETALGSALLLPVVGPKMAGTTLMAFSGGLLGLYARTAGMHDETYRPTQQGTPLAKDVWMFAIGSGLVIDAVLSRDRGNHDQPKH